MENSSAGEASIGLRKYFVVPVIENAFSSRPAEAEVGRAAEAASTKYVCDLPRTLYRLGGRKYVAHNHGNEYQVKIVHGDGIEELSGWMNSQEQVIQAMAAVHRPQGNAYWLRERNIVCPHCLDREQKILEYPLTDIPSPRFSPHDSRYLVAVGSRNRCAL